jgi:hypothetical protein
MDAEVGTGIGPALGDRIAEKGDAGIGGDKPMPQEQQHGPSRADQNDETELHGFFTPKGRNELAEAVFCAHLRPVMPDAPDVKRSADRALKLNSVSYSERVSKMRYVRIFMFWFIDQYHHASALQHDGRSD